MRQSKSARTSFAFEALENRTLLSASPRFTLAPLNPGGQITAAVAPQLVPNDPSYGSLWGMQKIQAAQAWDLTTGLTTVTVADIDSGIDYTHNDLYKNVWVNQAEIPADRRANLLDIDGDNLITLWDLNDPSDQGPGKITDTNTDGRIDARDLLAPAALGGWADGINGVSYGGYTYNSIAYAADPYVDDIIGWNFSTNTNNPFDGGTANGGHGTHTAGTIGAMGGNGIGVTGVNWKTQIMSLKIFGDDGVGVVDTAIAAAIRYAANNGAGVANASWGGSGGVNNTTDPLYASIQEAGQRKQMLFVASAGNGDVLFGNGYSNDAAATTFTYPVFPATYNLPNVIAVAATDSNDGLASFSNYGPTSVDLGAPGVGVLSTKAGNTYVSYNGTSMAAPHVTGVAALARSLSPNASYASLKSWILGGVDAVSSLAGKTVTGGRLNAFKTLQLIPVGVPATPSGLSAVAASSSRINLSWSDVAGESGYRLQRSTDSTFLNSALITTINLAPNITTYGDTNLAAVTTYYYRLQATGTTGDSNFTSPPVFATTQAAAPVLAAPSWVSAQATPTSVKLTWTNVAGETGYKIESLSGGVWKQIAAVGVDVTTYTNSGLKSRRAYSYRIRANNGSVNSAYSSTLTITTPRSGSTTVTPTALTALAAAGKFSSSHAIVALDSTQSDSVLEGLSDAIWS